MIFVSYSSQDEPFVNIYVATKLYDSLRRKIGLDKHLLCLGNRHFKPGRYIHEEIIATVQECAVVLILLTESYCRSRYCKTEFDEAYKQDKPILFMVKEPISDTLMTPTMKLLFQRNTRIHWKLDNGQYVLKKKHGQRYAILSWNVLTVNTFERSHIVFVSFTG